MKKTLLIGFIVVGIVSFSAFTAHAQSVNYLSKFFADVYGAFFGNSQTQKVDAQTVGNGTLTIHAQICQTLGNFENPSSATCSGTPRDPNSTESPLFVYDVQRIVGNGASAQVTTVLSGIGPGQSYSLPANTPNASNNNRDEYVIVFKGAPTNYLYVRQGGNFDLPYKFSISSGQNTQVNIPYVIYTAIESTGPVGTTVTADIVDGNGNFVRALTASEIQSVSFDIQHSVPATGGYVGSHANNFDTQVSSGKLNTSYQLATYVHSGSILTNIKPPSGYVVRSIKPGTYFDPTDDVTIHFTKSPVSSQVQKVDQMLYVPNGISYVKKIAQTYSDNEYKYSNLDVDLFAYYGNNNRPFPLNWTVAKYSGVPYLFMNGAGKIVIYNISDPKNPKQVSEYVLSGLEKFNQYKDRQGNTYGQCSPNQEGTHDFITGAGKVFALDDSPYLLIDIQRPGGPGPGGTAVLSLDPSTMAITAYPQWTECNSGQDTPGTAFGMYKGSDGNTYFISQFPNNAYDTGGVDTGNIGIYTINSAGIANKVVVLSGMSGIAPSLDYSNGTISVVSVGSKKYLIGNGKSSIANINSTSAPIYIYDISNPKNIIKINQQITVSTSGSGRLKIDEQANRMYVQSSIPNPAATSTSYTIPKTLPIWQVYDLSVLPSTPKLIATYNKPTDLLNSSQVNADFSQITKRLNIASSGNLVDINNSSFTYGAYGYSSSLQLINVSNNLAYISLYTNGKNPWDTIANQAGVTDGSEYGTNAIQFIVDVSNASSPKILGMIFGHTEYSAYGLSAGGWFDVPLYGSIYNYNGYIYRANFRIADVWKLGNPPAQSTGGAGSGAGASGTGTTEGGSAPSSVQSPFSFSSLLKIFQRVFNNQ